MENLKYLTEFIWAIIGIFILVFLFRNQKTLSDFIKSLSSLFSDVEVFKWGKRGELKIGKRLNKLIDKEKTFTLEKTHELEITPELVKRSEYEKEREELFLLTREQLLLMSTIALRFVLDSRTPESDISQAVQDIRDSTYKKIIESAKGKTDNIIYIDSLISSSDKRYPPIEGLQ